VGFYESLIDTIKRTTYSHLSNSALDVLAGAMWGAPSSVSLNTISVSAARDHLCHTGVMLGRNLALGSRFTANDIKPYEKALMKAVLL
jgi:hypothetical protein